jgi:hypothetical protein
MAIKYANNASTTLSSGISNSVTSIDVVDGSVFPALNTGDTTYVTLSTTDGNTTEIVKVTGISTDTLTVVRNASPSAFSSGDLCELRLTKELLEDTVDDLAPSTLATVAIVETVNMAAQSGTPYVPDLSTGTIFGINANATIEMPSTTVNGTTTVTDYKGKSFTVIEENSVTVSWEVSSVPITWSGGVTPSRTDRTIYSFLCDGVKWYGMEVGNGFGST